MMQHYSEHAPDFETLCSTKGWVLLEFGANECSICQQKRELIDQARTQLINVNYYAIQDGKGKKLGRQFQIKLWPSLIMLKDGIEVLRCIRPENSEQLIEAFRKKACIQ